MQSELNMSLSSLLQFVRSHDCAEIACIEDGAVWAVAFYTDAAGHAHEAVERVGSTLAECRRWLGY